MVRKDCRKFGENRIRLKLRYILILGGGEKKEKITYLKSFPAVLLSMVM